MRSANTRYCLGSEVTVFSFLPSPDRECRGKDWLVLSMSCFSKLIWGLLCEPVSILEAGAAVGMLCSHKNSLWAECKTVTKDLTSRKSSLIDLSFALMVPWPFLFSPHPLPPDFFPLPSGSFPPLRTLFASSSLYATTFSWVFPPFSPSLPPSFLLLPHPCFFIPLTPT